MRVVNSDSAPEYGTAPLSDAFVVDGDADVVYVAGQLGVDPETDELVEGGPAAETKQAFDNVSAVLAEAGASLDDVVKTIVFISDMAVYDEVNEAYRERLSEPYPPRSGICVNELVADGAVEIEVIATV